MVEGLEIWGGLECTINRVGDVFFDQMTWNGHAQRLEDLDRFAELGLRTLRYPLLWERIAPNGIDRANWAWADARLERLRALGIRPIVGLVHHGSGPVQTSLVDSSFSIQLAEYAQAVAERYPWVEQYTPVNEPLTTARFSGLYGHWYPHGRKEALFLRALLNQSRAVQRAMQAIRRVNPQAQLIQTEDLGKTFSTPRLAYQAEFENERRWLSLDLLTGRLTPTHTLWKYFNSVGIPESEILALAEAPCPPDRIGINYYVTSERFLDERLDLYPPEWVGGNGKDAYADVEVVRVGQEGIAGVGAMLREAWERYGLPLALTEVHLGAHREDQLRWLHEIVEEAQSLRRSGVDLRALTVWSLLGAYNWHCLVTRDEGRYESGVFDVRGAAPRPTALARAVRQLVQQGALQHPVLDTPGWWRRPERLLYPPVSLQPASVPAQPVRPTSARPLLIIGASGTLGQAFGRVCQQRGLDYRLLSRRELDITAADQIRSVLTTLQPWAVINAAGYVRVDQAEQEPELCLRVNASGAVLLAQACRALGLPFLTFSSDLVFDGRQSAPYLESSPVAPLNVYGRSKAEAEAGVLQEHAHALVIRTSAFFGPWDEHNFAVQALGRLRSGQAFAAAQDLYISPTFVPDLVHTSLDLLVDGETGLWHLANQGELTWADFARLLARSAGVADSRLHACSHQELGLAASRPRYSVLGSQRAQLLPPLEDAVARYIKM